MNGQALSQCDRHAADHVSTGRRITVGIGELAVTDNPDDSIVTHALGSCVAVCLFDPVANVAAMLHFLLPESKINEDRARIQPGAFADTGIPLLFQEAYRFGLEKKRAVVKLVGGAEVGGQNATLLQIGRRNALAAKNILWRNGVLINAQDLGGSVARTVHLLALDGRIQVFDGGERIKEL